LWFLFHLILSGAFNEIFLLNNLFILVLAHRCKLSWPLIISSNEQFFPIEIQILEQILMWSPKPTILWACLLSFSQNDFLVIKLTGSVQAAVKAVWLKLSRSGAPSKTEDLTAPNSFSKCYKILNCCAHLFRKSPNWSLKNMWKFY